MAAGGAGKVTFIMCVDPLLDPANGPNWFPFDDEILYEIKIDNDHDAREDITLQFRFETEQRLPNLFQVYAGAGNGTLAPANSPAPVAPGTPIVPPQITSFEFAGLGQRQRYTVTAIPRQRSRFELRQRDGRPLYAVPANVGPRTMDYAALFEQGIYDLSGGHQGVRRHDRRRVLDRPRRRRSTPSTCATRSRPGVLSARLQDAAAAELRAPTPSRATRSTPSRSRCRSRC